MGMAKTGGLCEQSVQRRGVKHTLLNCAAGVEAAACDGPGPTEHRQRDEKTREAGNGSIL